MNRSLTVAALGAVLLVATSCGGDSDSSDTPDSTTPTTVPASAAPVLTTAAAPSVTAGPTTAVALPGTTTAPTSTAATSAPTSTAAPRVVTSPSDNVRRGDTGAGVEQIQTALKAAGYDLGVDGVFGQVTDRAVRDYQGKNGLTVDGVVGPNTWAKLGSASASPTSTSTTAP